MPKKDDKKDAKGKGKDPKMAKAGASKKGAKAKKKKWSKSKVKDKANNAVVFDQATYDKFMKEVGKYKLITPSIISERLKISNALARVGIRILENDGKIKPVVHHRSQLIYTRAIAGDD